MDYFHHYFERIYGVLNAKRRQIYGTGCELPCRDLMSKPNPHFAIFLFSMIMITAQNSTNITFLVNSYFDIVVNDDNTKII